MTDTAAGARRGLLVVDLADGFGGAERRALDEVVTLAARDVPVLLVAQRNSPVERRARAAGVPVAAVDSGKYHPAAVAAVRRLCRDHAGWSIETHTSWARLCVLLAGGRGRTALATVHSTPERTQGRLAVQLWHVPLLRLAARRGWRLLAVAPSVHRHLVDDLGLPAEQVRTVWSGVGEPQTPARPAGALRAELGIEPDALVAASVGRLVALKQVPAVIEAFGQARRMLPQAHLLVVGDGPGLPEVLDAISRLPPADRDRVHLLGVRDDVDVVLQDTDLLVLASRTEAMPMVALEAASRGVPVVSTDVGSIREGLGPDAVHLLPPGTACGPELVTALRVALLRVLPDPAYRRRLTSAAAARVRERFGLDEMANAIVRAGRMTERVEEHR